jgi:hypothetical protein
MLKYIQNLVDSLKSVVSGMKKNPEKWANLPVTVQDVESDIAELEKADSDIKDAEQSLTQKREVARTLATAKSSRLSQLQNLAIGLHADNSSKLTEYNIDARKISSAKPVPGKVHIVSITDDVDGIGFILTIAKESEADHYEIEKGEATNVNDLVLAPPFPFFKTTTKTTIVDDDVKKGVRYFYRVRAINPSGSGEWSESVNKVQ